MNWRCPDITRRGTGLNFRRDGRCEIAVWAPVARAVAVEVENKAVLPLSGSEDGYWTAVTEQIVPGDLYRIRLNDDHSFPDPCSLSQPQGVHGPSRATDLTFPWTDAAWRNIPLDQYLIYELHTGLFSEKGTFEGIGEKLDYLADLGISALEIMPVAQFPGGRNWGYDGVFPFAVHNTYGGPAGLQRLVDLCHAKGLAVILDVVYNHMGPEGNYLGAFGPYFTDKYKTPWGMALNFDDAWCDGVRDFFVENALMWFRDFHIDALRLDAVHAIRDFSPVHILREIRTKVDELIAFSGRDHFLIVECDLNDNRFINPVDRGGYGMDAQWIDEFHHALRVAAGEARRGYYADFDGVGHLAKAYKDAYVYDGQYAPHRHRRFGVKTDNPGHQFVVFSQNHDQAGNRMLGERTSQLVSINMQRLLAAAVVVSPFIPLFFMGEEFSAPHPFLYFISHSDPELVAAVRKGRQEEFAAFQDQGTAPDPQSEKTFGASKLAWALLEQAQHAEMLQYYRSLLRIRRTNPVLRDLNRENLEVHGDPEHKTLVLHRWTRTDHLVCLLNFSPSPATMVLPRGRQWRKSFDSSVENFSKAAPDEPIPEDALVPVPPETLMMFFG